jgi:hypothetical protein
MLSRFLTRRNSSLIQISNARFHPRLAGASKRSFRLTSHAIKDAFNKKVKQVMAQNDWSLHTLAMVTAVASIWMVLAIDEESKRSKCETVASNTGSKDGLSKFYPKRAQNVMLHRMRSLQARSLDDKYIIDWETVIGEGAYGSVYPGRLAATGEKVW